MAGLNTSTGKAIIGAKTRRTKMPGSGRRKPKMSGRRKSPMGAKKKKSGRRK